MSRTIDTTDIAWPWPFTRADLTAGLRQAMADTSLWVLSAQPVTMTHMRPSIGRLRGMLVEYETRESRGTCRLVLKEPRGTTRTGLAGAGRREVGVYRSLAANLPLATPRLIAASPVGDWLILDAIKPAGDPSRWKAEDYRTAIDGLVTLHDRFMGLAEDLGAFPWLSRPLESDYEVHVSAAAQAIERIVTGGQPTCLARFPERMRVLANLTLHADRVAASLRHQTATLLHGDYWPGNIAALPDGSQIVYDWQLAGVGPGVMDLLVFVSKSLWWFGSLPLESEEIAAYYRERMAARAGIEWTDASWDEAWDHALMWRFLQEWIDLLAASTDSLLESHVSRIDQVWFEPIRTAMQRRLGVT